MDILWYCLKKEVKFHYQKRNPQKKNGICGKRYKKERKIIDERS